MSAGALMEHAFFAARNELSEENPFMSSFISAVSKPLKLSHFGSNQPDQSESDASSEKSATFGGQPSETNHS